MKKTLLFGIALQSLLFAQPYNFGPKNVIMDNGESLTLKRGYASPQFFDWDGDDKKDLIVGQFSEGKIRYYKNIGSQENPVFSGHEFLTADNVDISLKPN